MFLKEFEENETVFEQNTKGTTFWVILSGKIKVLVNK